MADLVKSAGLQGALAAQAAPATSHRREAVKLIRATLRKQDATEDELDDALEALIELARD